MTCQQTCYPRPSSHACSYECHFVVVVNPNHGKHVCDADAQLSAPQRAKEVVRKLQSGVPKSKRVLSLEDGLAAAIMQSLATITQLNLDSNRDAPFAPPAPAGPPPPTPPGLAACEGFKSSHQKTFKPGAKFTITNHGCCVKLEGDDGYAMSVLSVPFPASGRHTATIVFTSVRSSQNYATAAGVNT